jgi:hypothetical protein
MFNLVFLHNSGSFNKDEIRNYEEGVRNMLEGFTVVDPKVYNLLYLPLSKIVVDTNKGDIL